MSSLFKSVADFMTPVLTSSAFAETGVLTVDEFVAAGDQLVHSSRQWQWGKPAPGTEKSYLPKDKQFLTTRNVPCRQRATELINQSINQSDVTVENEDGDEGWLSTNNESTNQSIDEKQDEVTDINQTNNQSINQSVDQSDDEIQDIDDIEDEDLMVHQPVEDDSNDTGILRPNHSNNQSNNQSTYLRAVEPIDNIVKTRTYDLSIVYDKFYRVPRLYLFGYNENRQSLSANEMFADISSEHALKTVTFEPHPFNQSINHASIHPCKHANVMKRLCDTMSGADSINQSNNQSIKKIQAKDSMFVFLKFMTAVIPTIEYDFSMH